MHKFTSLLLGTSVAVGIVLAGNAAYAADLPMAAPVAAPAAAPASAGAYISVFGGYALPMDVHGVYSTDTASFTAPFGSGYVIGGALGMHLMPNLRGEVEVSYSSRDVSGLVTATVPNNPPFTATSTTGSGSILYAFGNLWYDLDIGNGITPYLGGGLGAAVMMPNFSYVGGPGGTFDSASSATFAGQLGAGLRFQLADNITADVGYRVKGLWNGELSGSADGKLTGVNLVDQSVQVGLSLGF